jgi:hypothetical protein
MYIRAARLFFSLSVSRDARLVKNNLRERVLLRSADEMDGARGRDRAKIEHQLRLDRLICIMHAATRAALARLSLDNNNRARDIDSCANARDCCREAARALGFGDILDGRAENIFDPACAQGENIARRERLRAQYRASRIISENAPS